MSRVQSLRRELHRTWDDGLGQDFRDVTLAFFLLFFIALCASLLLPQVRDFGMAYIEQLFSGKELLDSSGAPAFAPLLSNNLTACIMMMFYGLIPFIRLPALGLGVNAMIPGVMLAQYIVRGQSVAAFLAGVVPHAIFEIPALLLAMATGLFVCRRITGRFRGDKSMPGFTAALAVIARSTLAALPLLIAAAAVEAWITPLVFSLVS